MNTLAHENTSPAKRTLLRYASLGVPLGFLGLPLYMHLPHYYAKAFGIPLSVLGGIFLISRLVDCLADPWFGRRLDQGKAGPLVLLGALAAMIGMALLFTLPDLSSEAPSLALITALLVITYLGYSIVSIRFYASGVGLGPTPRAASAVSSWREGMLIVGVLLGAAAPGMGMSYTQLAVLFAILLCAALWWGRALLLRPAMAAHATPPLMGILKRHGRLYAVFFFNALAPATTATLYLFFMEEVLGAPELSAPYLLAYFIAAVLAMPLWVRLAARYGKVACLLAAMVLAIVSFIYTSQLGAGDASAFLIICLLTGIAFGADAALLPSLMSDELSASRTSENAAFGIWMAISKLTLALAAGLALPAVDVLQTFDTSRIDALRFTYGLLPCAIKMIALGCFLSYHRHLKRSHA